MTTSPASPRVALPRVSTVEAVAQAVRARVCDGEIEQGAQLREADLVETYGVARHCVRAALQALVHEGLLRHHPNRGVFVPQLTKEDAADLHTVRSMVESEAVRLICERRASLARLHEALAALESLAEDGSWSDLIVADLEVHQAIVDAGGSPRMRRIYGSLVGELRLFLAFFHDKSVKRRALRREHSEIVEALTARDAELAQSLLRKHLVQAAVDMEIAIAAEAEGHQATR